MRLPVASINSAGNLTVLRRLKSLEHPNRNQRILATAVAMLVMVAQLMAAAHVHPGMLIKSVSDSAKAGVAEVVCPVCVFHAHGAANTAALFMLIVPCLAEASVATATRSRLLSTPKPQLFGRAPPLLG